MWSSHIKSLFSRGSLRPRVELERTHGSFLPPAARKACCDAVLRSVARQPSCAPARLRAFVRACVRACLMTLPHDVPILPCTCSSMPLVFLERSDMGADFACVHECKRRVPTPCVCPPPLTQSAAEERGGVVTVRARGNTSALILQTASTTSR